MTDRARAGKSPRLCVMLIGLALLASVASAAAQSKGYRPPPPPPPPPPRPAAPVAPPPRTMNLPAPRPQTSSPAPQAAKPNATAAVPRATVPPPKGGTTPKGGSTAPKAGTKMNPSELQKEIGSHSRQIDTYRSKVSNPSANHPNWNALSREQQGALLRQWNDEIRRHEASRATAQRMLSQKAR